jgi:hypothetical protein
VHEPQSRKQFLINSSRLIARHARETSEALALVTHFTKLYYMRDASRDYDPSMGLECMKAVVLAINSADDARNPPETGSMECELKRVKNERLGMSKLQDCYDHGEHLIPRQLRVKSRRADRGWAAAGVSR